jgi:hypothetical protein
MLEIDTIPLHNTLYNIFIGLVGACGYAVLSYLKQRHDRRIVEKSDEATE